MKGKRFSVEQIVAVVKQAELGLPVADPIRQVGISEPTFFAGRRNTPASSRSRPVSRSSSPMKTPGSRKLVAELSLDKAVLQDVLAKPPGERS